MFGASAGHHSRHLCERVSGGVAAVVDQTTLLVHEVLYAAANLNN